MNSQSQSVTKGPRESLYARALFARWPALLGFADFVAITVAAYFNPEVPWQLRMILVLGVPTFLVLAGVYATRLRVSSLSKAGLTIGVIVLMIMAVIAVNFLWLGLAVTPTQIVRLCLISIAAVIVGRMVVSPLYRLILKAVRKRRTLIIGSGVAAVLVAEKIESHPELDLSVVGFVDEGPRKSVRGRPEPLLGGLSEITAIIEREAVEVAILGYTVNNTKEILGALYRVEPKVEVLMMPRYFEFVSAGMRVDDLAGMPLLRLGRHQPTLSERIAKRAEDIILGGLFTLIVAPIVPFVALAIKLDSPGPIFFKQERIGKNGRTFHLYKFRSMASNAAQNKDALKQLADDDPRSLKNRTDVRVTRVGAFLRKFSIDELPQLINVLKGDMSLVGPRPPVAAEVDAYEEWQKKRLAVTPGITGIWQVSGRSDLPFDERVWLDFMYIDSWSVWLDLGIILQTIPAVISTRGAY